MISNKIFQLAKNIGFDLKTCNCGGFPECICDEEKPTLYVLQKWLREIKFVDVLPAHQFSQSKNQPIMYDVCVTTSINNIDCEYYCNYTFEKLFLKYEDSLEFGIINAIEIIKNKNK